MALFPSTPNSPGKLISAAGTNATNLKSAACVLGYLCPGNVGSGPAYLKIYDKATAPTVGTDVPVQSFLVPGSLNDAGSNILPPGGITLNNGLSIALTGGMADTDTTAVAAAQVVVNYGTR